MGQDIDTLSMALTKAAFGSDKLQPNLKSKLKKLIGNLQHNGQPTDVVKSEMKSLLTNELVNAINGIQTLAKNELMASTFSDGSIKLDFGSGIPAHIKKAALSWAKRRGLKPVEASLDKSVATASYVVLSKSGLKGGECINKTKWALPL